MELLNEDYFNNFRVYVTTAPVMGVGRRFAPATRIIATEAAKPYPRLPS